MAAFCSIDQAQSAIDGIRSSIIGIPSSIDRFRVPTDGIPRSIDGSRRPIPDVARYSASCWRTDAASWIAAMWTQRPSWTS
jgi:hypothetical protein